MNMSHFSASLDHIDNQELARLAGLWRAQASSGHAEALSIAHSFSAEQRRRAGEESLLTPDNQDGLIRSVWRKFWH